MRHLVVFGAAFLWFVLTSIQTVFLARHSRWVVIPNFVASVVWILLIKNLLVGLDYYMVAYALGTVAGCLVGMEIGHRFKR